MKMTVYDEILAELRAIRVRIDQLAARVLGEQTNEELRPVYWCGHRHASREEAAECKRRQDAVNAAAAGDPAPP